MARRKSRIGGWFKFLLIVAAVVALVVGGLAAFRVGPPPTIEIGAALPGIGKRTPVTVTVAEPERGLSSVTVELVQGDRVVTLAERTWTPLEPWALWGRSTPSDELALEVGSEVQEGLTEGEAEIRVTAGRASSLLRHPEPAVETVSLPVILRPPTLHVSSSFHFVAQGGCEAVVYVVGDTAVESGVRAGEWFFPGFPLPGGTAQQRFALFSAPWDMGDAEGIRLVARDAVGNESTAAFIDRFTPRPPRRDTIRLSESFLERVVPPIMAQTPELSDQGSLLDNYLLINGELRARNSATLVELAAQSRPEFLWSKAFLPMRNAQVMSDFADRRTYVYEGREVDQQTHLGFDLASTSMADLQASAGGVVVLARYFGIYGNAVVIDHGYGLMTLYGHMSSIAVEEGQEVARGDVIGRSGATGLAGGDHLHFTVLLGGLPVDPREWWDDHWIADRLDRKLGPALPFGN